ncbi:MAG: DNA primase [Holophagales bacterium]|jgi:DNA primase|nr:DNA primase [Holophagales bacterium]
MHDKELIQQIKDATNLVELVGQTVKLRKQGNAWIGLCPFHSEKTASFHVVPEKGFYHCFGCNKTGDAFSWLMERDGLTFVEAKEQLAKSAGIELPKFRGSRDPAKDDLTSKLRSALEITQSFFQRRLEESEEAKNYLRKRGIEDDFAKDVGFGYAPDGWENVVNLLRKNGFSSELIEQTGVAVRNDRGNLRDFMHSRLTIPIHDNAGRIVAFGGREIAPSGQAGRKYLHTRETLLFKKSEILFGFHRAKAHMRDGALLVEGYFDVLQLHQAGINQAIAPLGTALTEGQLKSIAKYTKKIVLCFDGDEAGQRATERALKLALQMGLDPRILILPQDEDPDTCCIRMGAMAFRDTIRRAPDWVGYLLDRARQGRNLKKITEKMEVFESFVAYYSYMPAARAKENWTLLQSVAAELGVPKHEIDRAIKNQRAMNVKVQNEIEPDSGGNITVDDLLKPLIAFAGQPDAKEEILSVPVGWWDYLDGAATLQAILECNGDESALPSEILMAKRKIEAAWASHGGAFGQAMENAMKNIEKAYIFKEMNLIGQTIKNIDSASDPESKSRLEARYAQLMQRGQQLQRSILRQKQ